MAEGYSPTPLAYATEDVYKIINNNIGRSGIWIASE